MKYTAAKKGVRKIMRSYRGLRPDDPWRLLINQVYHDIELESTAKARLLHDLFMNGSRRGRADCVRLALSLHVAEATIYCWANEITNEIVFRAVRDRMI